MIIPKIWARLGNQCFQIAAAVAHAKKMGTDWAVPNKTLDPRIWPTYFTTLPKAGKYVPAGYYKEKRHCYDPIPPSKDLLIEGYFQSEKYFIDAKKEVSIALGFVAQPDHFVAVHIRRGDYLHYPDHHPVLPYEYYHTAIMEMVIRGYEQFVIYSDDIPYCKTIFDTDYYKGLNILYCFEPTPLISMYTMYNASAFIIANSTFSLFPALLRQDNPLVIAPAEKRWYGPKNAHLETCDLMPERFIKI